MSNKLKNTQISINRFKVTTDGCQLTEDVVAVEEPMQLSLLHRDYSQVFTITMRTPGNDQYLALGMLLSEGVISRAQDVIGINQIVASPTASHLVKHEELLSQSVIELFDGNQLEITLSPEVELNLEKIQRRYVSHSGCGLCGKTQLQALELKPLKPLKAIPISLSLPLIKMLRKRLSQQPLFSETGGVHAAGFVYVKAEQIDWQESSFFEDVGRHNALDKLIGYELQKNDLQQPGILVLSGRVGFELMQKAIMAGFSLIVALGAPTSLAIQAANQFNIMLVGFTQDNRFNLYTSHQNYLE